MIKKIENNILENNLFKKEDRIIVAVSGGIDSMVLLNILFLLGYKCVVAHCNFSLRGEESNEDEKLVKQIAQKYGYEVVVSKFDTENYAKINRISIQMAARQLRYSFFDKVSNEYQIKAIAVAHHLDDSIETFFVNIIRGTGLRGMTGIKSINKKVIRPLLCATKVEIEQYAIENNIEYRLDSSNLENKYLRNKLRNNIIPQFVEISSEFKQIQMSNINTLSDTYNLLIELFKEVRKKIVSVDGDVTFINVFELLKFENAKTVLYFILSEFGFNSNQVNEVYASLSGGSGKQFMSASYRLVKDRNNLVLTRNIFNDEVDTFYINNFEDVKAYPINLKFEIINIIDSILYEKDSKYAYVDLDLLRFPLVITKWKDGDSFIPLGMNGFKKLSDFFIDNKIPVNIKNKIWLVKSKNDIVWVTGMRIDDRFKVTANTKKVLKIKLVSK